MQQSLLSYWWRIVPDTIRKPWIPLGRWKLFSSLPMCDRSTNLLTKELYPFLKLAYKWQLITSLVETHEKSEELREASLHAKKGRKGLQFGCAANVLDACCLCEKVWDSISTVTLAGCWKHSKCLPHIPSVRNWRHHRRRKTKNFQQGFCCATQYIPRNSRDYFSPLYRSTSKFWSSRRSCNWRLKSSAEITRVTDIFEEFDRSAMDISSIYSDRSMDVEELLEQVIYSST